MNSNLILNLINNLTVELERELNKKLKQFHESKTILGMKIVQRDIQNLTYTLDKLYQIKKVVER